MRKFNQFIELTKNDPDMGLQLYCWYIASQKTTINGIEKFIKDPAIQNSIIESLLKYDSIFDKNTLTKLFNNPVIINNFFDIKDQFDLADYLKTVYPNYFYHNNILKTLIEKNLSGKNIYCLFDSKLFSFALFGNDYDLNIEITEKNDISDYLVFLNKMKVFNHNIDIRIGDPIALPSFSNGLELQKFDNSLVFLFSKFKFDYDFESDPFGRFEYSHMTKRYYVHILEHLLAQTKGNLVAFLPSNFFSDETKPVKEFKKSLLSKRLIDKIYFLEKNVFKQTNEHLSMIVLNKEKKSDIIKVFDYRKSSDTESNQPKSERVEIKYNKKLRLNEYTESLFDLTPKKIDVIKIYEKQLFDFTKLTSDINNASNKSNTITKADVKKIRQPKVEYFYDDDRKIDSLYFHESQESDFISHASQILNRLSELNKLPTLDNSKVINSISHENMIESLKMFYPEDLWITDEKDEEIPRYRILEINNQSIDDGFIYQIHEKDIFADMTKLIPVRPFDLLINAKGNISKAAIVPPAKYILNSDTFEIEIKGEEYSFNSDLFYTLCPIFTSQNILILRFQNKLDAILAWLWINGFLLDRKELVINQRGFLGLINMLVSIKNGVTADLPKSLDILETVTNYQFYNYYNIVLTARLEINSRFIEIAKIGFKSS